MPQRRARGRIELGALAAALALSACATRLPLDPPRDPPVSAAEAPIDPIAGAEVPPPPREVIENPAALPDAVPRVEAPSRYGNPPSYVVFGRRYFVLAQEPGYREQGIASWYGPGFHGERTSSGETYDMYAMTAAHKTLPLPAFVRVQNLENGRSVIVRVNDRGPFVGDRIIDLSYSAAAKIDMTRRGTARVAIELLQSADGPTSVGTQVPPVAQNAGAGPSEPVRWLQVGAFSVRDNAERLSQRLKASGFTNVAVQAPSALDSRQVFRVRLGPLTTAADSDALILRLQNVGIFDARLSSH
jgi:rare lipoprotein A